MERVIPGSAMRKLARRKPLPVRPERAIAVKRDVHEFIVEADAARFIDCFRELVTSPDSLFGLIRVKRPAARMGQPFLVGERFQGSFSLERALLGWLGHRRWLERLLGWAPLAWLVRQIEDAMLSNYAEIVTMELSASPTLEQPARLTYAYLDGTPIAGRSTFTIEPIAPGRCRFTQTFEYQEINPISLATFQRFGLKFHDQVVHEQVRQAASRAGASAAGTIPHDYATIAGAGQVA